MEPYYAYVRMINGDEVLGLITNEDSIEITINRPVFILRQRIENGEGFDTITFFITWLPRQFTNAEQVTVGRDKVIFSVELDENTKNMVKNYAESGYTKTVEPPEKLKPTSTEVKQPIAIDPFDALEGLLDPKKN